MIYLDLLLGFLRVGCFSFGGAYGAIPLIRDVVQSYGWLNDEALSTMIAVSESTPGPIMVNMATYVGSTQGGLLGALIATLAVVLPAFVIILLVMVAFEKMLKNKYMQALLRGLKPSVIGIIMATGGYMILDNLFAISAGFAVEAKAVLLMLLLLAILYGSKPVFKKKITPIQLIVTAAVLGVLFYGI